MSAKSGFFHRLSSRRFRRQSPSQEENPQPIKPDPETNQIEEVIWIDDAESKSISSENMSPLAYENYKPESHQRIWEDQEITSALSKLPAGESALDVVPMLTGEKLERVLLEVENSEFDSPESMGLILLVSKFVVGRPRKSFSGPDGEAANSATPAELLRKWPNTCLLVSSWFGKTEIVSVLLKRGATVTSCDCDGRTALHLAACIGAVNVIKELLKNGASPAEWDFEKKYTPLHCAAAAANVAAVQCLVEAGADVDAGLSGRSPLHYAILSGATECAEVLLKAGASPNNPQVFTETPLHVAARLGSSASVKLLLNYGADVRVQFGSSRSTALQLAAEEDSPECVKLLLEAGSPCDAVNYRGQSAVHLAALVQSPETLEVLIERGANVDVEDGDGRTPLHAAVASATKGSEVSVKLLVQASRALVNKPDKFGYTPLHIAALNENSSIVMLLLSKGADVTARTKGGVSALSFIARRTPDVLPRLVSRLDQAISLHEHELGDVDCELKLDFKPFLSGSRRGETELMLCFVEVGQRHILEHPLCESFLHLKWLRIRKFFLISLVFHSVFAGIFTSYIIATFLLEIDELSDDIFPLVVAFIFVLAGKELFQLVHGIQTYARSWENVLQWSVIIASGLVSMVRPVVHNWQHHVASIGILLVWVELMMVVGRFPMFGIYVQMFTQVSVNFFKFLGAYSCLIVGFGLGFSVLHNNYKSFEEPMVSLLKTIIMMSGEIEFEDIFFSKEAPIQYRYTAHLMLLAFVILVTVILTNLMVGLAVSDIQELRRCAGLDRLVRRAELVAYLESLLFSRLLDYAPKRIIEPCRNGALLLKLPHYCAFNIRPNDPREKRLPRDLVKSICRLVTEKKNRGNRNNACWNVNAKFAEKTSNRSVSTGQLDRRNSLNEPHRNQIQELALQLEQCSQNILLNLDGLTSKIQNIARVLDISDYS